MPSSRQIRADRHLTKSLLAVLTLAAIIGLLCASSAQAQIASVTDVSGRRMFVNEDLHAGLKVAPTPSSPRFQSIYMTGEFAFMGKSHPAVSLNRDGVEKLVREASERYHVDPALVRAVIQTESNWNTSAFSRKGAMGLMQLIPTTAQRFGANDAFNPKQNVEAGVRYLSTLLERYNGNLDLALAAYNAGEGAVDRAHGIPSFRETRNYVQRVQQAYFSPGSGRMGSAYVRQNQIHRVVDSNGRIVFTNE